MPPCAICEEAALAPEQKSPRSTMSTSTPFNARSRKVPMPLIPAPTISTEISGLFLREERISVLFIFLQKDLGCEFHQWNGFLNIIRINPRNQRQKSTYPIKRSRHSFLPIRI